MWLHYWRIHSICLMVVVRSVHLLVLCLRLRLIVHIVVRLLRSHLLSFMYMWLWLLYLWLLRVFRSISLYTAHILASNLSTLVHKAPRTLLRRHKGYLRYLINLCIDEVQPHSSSTFSLRFPTIQAISWSFVAFQMAFTAGEAASAYTPRFLACGCYRRLRHGLILARSGHEALLDVVDVCR